MSLSEQQRQRFEATPWALDELELPEIFMPVGRDGLASHADDVEEEVEEVEQPASPQERARIEAAAYAHGRADGEKMARNELTPQLESAMAALSAALDIVQRHQARWMANIEENIAVVAVVAARHIIAREVEIDATVVGDLVQRALVQFPVDHTITVRLNPDDVKTCHEQLQSSGVQRPTDIRWTSDPLIQRGGALVEGRERIIDGRVDTALERVYRLLGNLQA
jgi:flagellar biosynthesis/type III secretory pathway protein FliH